MGHPLYWTTANANSIDTVGWRPQKRLLNAEATVAPALASAFGKVWCVHNDGVGGNCLWSASFDPDNGWKGETKIPNDYTQSRPALSLFEDGRLYCAYQGQDNNTTWYISTANGTDWGPTQSVGGATIAGPALVTYKSQLWYLYYDKNNYLICDRINDSHLGSSSWSAPQSGVLGLAAAVGAFPNEDPYIWCVTVSGTYDNYFNSNLFVSETNDGTTWFSNFGTPMVGGAASDAGAALVYLATENLMLCVYGHEQDSTLWYIYSKGDPNQWSSPTQIIGASRAPGTGVGLTVHNGLVVCAYCGAS